ncbi:hypothetical protein Tco_1224229, partial [Tanacetum coccineum]
MVVRRSSNLERVRGKEQPVSSRGKEQPVSSGGKEQPVPSEGKEQLVSLGGKEQSVSSGDKEQQVSSGNGCTKGPQLEKGENLNTEAPGTERTPPGGTSALAEQVKGGPSPAFVKENMDVLRTVIKELDNRGQEKKYEDTPLMGSLGQGAEVGLGLLENIERVSRRRRGSLKSVKSKPQSVRASRRKSSSDS